MAYELHIERSKKKPITLPEWIAAIEACKGVRLFSEAEHKSTNPKTGEVIRIASAEGTAEVLFPGGEWHAVFRWGGKSAAFAARFDTKETSHPVWAAAVALATRLGAKIRGDEGETYDPKTGEPAD